MILKSRELPYSPTSHVYWNIFPTENFKSLFPFPLSISRLKSPLKILAIFFLAIFRSWYGGGVARSSVRSPYVRPSCTAKPESLPKTKPSREKKVKRPRGLRVGRAQRPHRHPDPKAQETVAKMPKRENCGEKKRHKAGSFAQI